MSADQQREVDDRIADWVDGRLSERDRERFVAELRVNPQLRRDLEEYERTVAAVQAALRAPTARVDLADRVLATIAAGHTAPVHGGSLLRWRPLLWSVATAAALLVVALLVDAWSSRVTPTKATQTAQFDREKDRQDGRATTGGAAAAKTPALDQLLVKKDAEPQRRLVAEEEPRAAARLMQDALHGEVPADRPPPAAGAPAAASRVPPEAPASDPVVDQAAKRELRAAGAREPGAADGAPGPVGVPPAANERSKQTPDGGAPNLEMVTIETGIRPAAPGATVVFGESSAAGPAPAPVEPLPLVVVLGRAPAAQDLFRLRARKETAGVAAGAAGEGKAAADTARRCDEFFTAQVAELAQAAALAGARDKKREAGRGQPPDAAGPPSESTAAWLQVAEVRLRRLERPVAVRTAGTAPQDEAEPWVERDWLVEGTRQDVAALLQRLAVFTAGVDLQLRTGETTRVPATKAPEQASEPEVDAFLDAQQRARQRVVLRFRLQAR